MAIGAFGPTQSALGPYFFGQQPNVMVLAASSESKVNGPVTDLGAMTNVTNTFTMNDIKSDSISEALGIAVCLFACLKIARPYLAQGDVFARVRKSLKLPVSSR